MSSPPPGLPGGSSVHPSSQLSAHDRRSGRIVAAGAVVFLIGLMALGVTLAVWARQGSAPGAMAALALLCPVGFAVAFAGLVVQARAGRRP